MSFVLHANVRNVECGQGTAEVKYRFVIGEHGKPFRAVVDPHKATVIVLACCPGGEPCFMTTVSKSIGIVDTKYRVHHFVTHDGLVILTNYSRGITVPVYGDVMSRGVH